MRSEAERVRAFEHAGWERAAPHYGASFAHATAGFVEALLDAARVAAGDKVLDVASGPGILAAAAAVRGARAQGLDFSAAMVALAGAAYPAVPFRLGDAEDLPFGDGDFDALVANFGFHHFPQPGRALAEARRVLRRGGRIAFTSWAAPADNPAWGLLFAAIAEHGDPNAAQAPPPGGGLRDEATAAGLLEGAGFTKIAVGRETRQWRVAAAGDLVEGFRRGTVRTAALIEAQSPSALRRIAAAVADGVRAYRTPEGYAVPVTAILAQAEKP